jgi:hypothetical protein
MLGARRGALRGGIWGRRAAVLSLGLSQWGERGQGQPAAQNRHHARDRGDDGATGDGGGGSPKAGAVGLIARFENTGV